MTFISPFLLFLARFSIFRLSSAASFVKWDSTSAVSVFRITLETHPSLSSSESMIIQTGSLTFSVVSCRVTCLLDISSCSCGRLQMQPVKFCGTPFTIPCSTTSFGSATIAGQCRKAASLLSKRWRCHSAVILNLPLFALATLKLPRISHPACWNGNSQHSAYQDYFWCCSLQML
uniref:Secreted protein n=1 Tax=Arundo donax TaxID=35708 RepID=A0A0A9G998_ARUDO